MNDLISRQAALEAIKNAELGCEYDAVEALPSVNHVGIQGEYTIHPAWIPVTERLPNGQELVIVSCHDTSGDGSFDYTASGWITTDGEYWIVDNEINHFVVAWMPLPEPYKGEK